METNAEYHANPALSFSGFKRFLISPRHYRASIEQPQPGTPAMAFGRLVHTLCLEPHAFPAEYAVAPNVDRRTKDGKALWAEFVTDAGNRQLVTQADVDLAQNIRAAVSKVLAMDGMVEQTHRVQSRFGALQCRPDLDADGVLWDLKTTVSVVDFDRSFFRYGYHLQCAFYRYVYQLDTGALPPPIRFVAVEKTPPFDVVIRWMPDAYYTPLVRLIEQGLERYAECAATDTWPGVDAGAPNGREITVPPWIENEIGGATMSGIDIDALFAGGAE